MSRNRRYRINVEREDPAKLHVCVPTITNDGDSYRCRVAEAKRNSPRTPPGS